MVKKIILLLTLIFVIVCFVNCQIGKFLPVETENMTYRGKLEFKNQFRTDGFYYNGEDSPIFVQYFFKDGFVCAVGGSDYKIYTENQNNNCVPITDMIRSSEYSWGYYVIEGDIIKIQRPYPINQYWKVKIEEYRVIILNDTTIQFFKRIYPKEVGGEREINWVYHFKYCSDKPDSTNILMDIFEREEMKKRKKSD